MRCVLGTVFPHQDDGDIARQSAQNFIGRVDDVPLFFDLAGLGHESGLGGHGTTSVIVRIFRFRFWVFYRRIRKGIDRPFDRQGLFTNGYRIPSISRSLPTAIRPDPAAQPPISPYFAKYFESLSFRRALSLVM